MMPVTWRASLGYLLRHPWQLALSIVGVGIGVAVIVAVDLANSSARTAFLLSMDAVSGEATHQVVGGPRGVDEHVYAELRVTQGFANIAPVVDGSAMVDGTNVEILGIDLFAEPAVRSFTSPAASIEGVSSRSLFRSFLARPGSVTMSRATAARLGLSVGDRFIVRSSGRTHDAELIGIFDSGDAGALENILVVDIATAQEWLDRAGWLSRIDVRIDDGDAATLDRLESSLPQGTRVLGAAGRTQTTVDLSRAFMTNLTAMSLLALLVGLFLIYNSVSFSVLQRRHLIGVLRALGMTRRQVIALVLGEAATIGLVAAGIGVLLGIVLGEELLQLVSRSINDLYFRVSVTDVSVSTFTIGKGIVAGGGAALVAAAVPAFEATGYQPRLAMARSTIEHRTRALLPVVALLGVATMALAFGILLLSGKNLVAGLTAVFMLILGFALCVPLAIRAATKTIAPRIGRTVARLAVSGVAAGLSRTGVAIVALAVAVSATIGVSVMVDSFRGSVDRWLTQTLQADIYVGVQRGALDKGIVADIAGLAPVEAISTSRRAWIEDERGRTQVVAIRMAPGSFAGTTILDRDPANVWPVWERDDAVLVSEPYAYRNDVRPGDKLDLRTDRGPRSFTILATYQSYDINADAVLMSRTTYDRSFDDDGIDSIGLYLADGADVGSVMRDIEAISDGRQQITSNSNARIRQLSLDVFDQTFVITDVLYWLATGVALIGILASMLALQLENGREHGVLRALGMTPGQVGGMITLQTGAIGLLSGVFALPLGVVMAWVLIEVINRRAFGWQIDMVVAPDILLTAVAFAASAALLAGLYPAWRAGRTEPAIAMREE